MKIKSILLICIVVLLAAMVAGFFLYGRSANPSIAIDAEHFPDENFRTYISDLYDRNDDGMLDRSEIRTAQNCTPVGLEIRSLKGIEVLTDLECLNCSGNELESLDVSQNTKLEELVVSNNPLEELDLSNNLALIELTCHYTLLKSLDVKDNTQLKILDCADFVFAELDISGHPSLEEVTCNSKTLTRLIAHDCTALKEISVYYSLPMYVDLHGCSALNSLNFIPHSDSPITLDLRDCDNLKDYPEGERVTILK